jgi:hypothetical protein
MGTPEERGIIPRLSNHLFEIVNEKILTQTSTKFMITVSYLEIYNERVKVLYNIIYAITMYFTVYSIM